MSVMSGLLLGNARTGSHPHWDTLTAPSQSCSLHVNARDCSTLATLPRLWGSLSPCSQGEGSLVTFCSGLCQSRVSLTFPRAPSWMKAQTGW